MEVSRQDEVILEKEKEILKEEKKIELEAEKLSSLSSYMRRLLRKDLQHKEREEKFVEEETTFVQKFVIDKAKRHKILFPLVVVTAVVLVWRGLWGIFDATPILSSSYISLIAGVFLLWLFNKFTDL